METLDVACLEVPGHVRLGTGGCGHCVRNVLEAVRARSSPDEAFQHFSAALQAAADEVFKPRRWWTRKPNPVSTAGLDFARTAREIAAIALFNQQHTTEKGFPSQTSYRAFRTQRLGLPTFSSLPYYRTQALLANCPVPYLLHPDRETIAQLEQHSESLTVPADIQHIIRNHTGVYDYNGSGRVVPPDVERLGEWITGNGHLPRPVVTYRQESTAHSGSGDAARVWKERLARAARGDEISWADRAGVNIVGPRNYKADELRMG